MKVVAASSSPESKILLVDDKPQNLYALEQTLKELPAKVITAASGADALALTLKHDFAVAILDVQMPGMDGYELAELLLGDPTTCRIPIIFVTAAYADEGHRFKGYDAGAVDYIVKPIDPTIFLGKVRVFIELARYRADLEGLVEEQICALRASEQSFADLFHFAPQAMIMVDAALRIVKTNSAAQLLFGYSADEFAKLPLSKLMAESNDGGAFRSRVAACFTEDDIPATRTLGASSLAQRSGGSTFRASIGLASLVSGGTPFVVLGINDVSDEVAAHEAVAASLREKELLLREVHHRVNNNLQIVSSILGLQTDRSPRAEARRVLSDSASRVRSMALIHRELYSAKSLAHIDFGGYTRTLTEMLHDALDREARVDVCVEPVELALDKAAPCALILNELVTNALKYGRSSDGSCHIRVQVARDGDNLRLTVSDNGPGLPEDFDLNATDSLGMWLINSLVKQIRATFTATSDSGLQCCVRMRLGEEP